MTDSDPVIADIEYPGQHGWDAMELTPSDLTPEARAIYEKGLQYDALEITAYKERAAYEGQRRLNETWKARNNRYDELLTIAEQMSKDLDFWIAEWGRMKTRPRTPPGMFSKAALEAFKEKQQ